MIRTRINKLKSQLSVDAILISDPKNLFYYSGFTGGEATLVMTKNENLIFTDSRYYVQARAEARDFELRELERCSPLRFIKDTGSKSVGFMETDTSVSVYEQYKRILNGIELVGISSYVCKNRQIKDSEEIKNIKTAAQIADNAFTHILDVVKAGVCERNVALELEFFMKKQGASGVSFDTIVASGVRSCMPHGVFSDKIIENGDFVTMDFGCFYHGYASDMTRTVAVGNVSDEMKRIYDTVLYAQTSALKKLSPNANNCDIDKTARDIINLAGYEGKFGHSLGHSLGLNIHEMPVLSPKSKDKLMTGMLMTVEPGIYIDNFCGVRIEDLTLITENGYENLTKSEKNLIII